VTHDEFEAWFTQVLRSLYPNRDAGFAIVITAFPPLERYLRQKTGIGPSNIRDPNFYDALLGVFPELKSPVGAKQFWDIHRHGLLHQCTFNTLDSKGQRLADGIVSHDHPIDFDAANDRCWLNPIAFAERVIDTITRDFATFEGTALPLPVVKDYPATVGYASYSATMGPTVFLGTAKP
jgi:hypothetical protein